jgi:hypothetical protein
MNTLLLAVMGVVLPAAALAADISGAWKIDSSVGTTPISINCTLVQAGHALSGACAPAVGDAGPTALTGTVDGNKAAWGYDVVFRGKPAHVGYTADIASDAAMAGVLELSGKPSPFTAARRPGP